MKRLGRLLAVLGLVLGCFAWAGDRKRDRGDLEPYRLAIILAPGC